MLLIACLAHAAGGWREVSVPEADAVAIADHPNGVVVLGQAGSLWQRRGEDWEALSSTTTGGTPTALTVDGQGGIWASSHEPAIVWRLDEGGWGPAEYLPQFITGWAPGRDGRAYACVGYVCTFQERQPGGGWQVRSHALDYAYSGWVGRDGQPRIASTLGVFRVSADGEPVREAAPEGTRRTTALPDGRRIHATGDGLLVAGPGQEPVLMAASGAHVESGREQAWLMQQGRFRRLVPPGQVEVREPTSTRRWIVDRQDRLWVLGSDGSVHVSVDTPSLTVQDVSGRWLLPAGRFADLLGADLDRDGVDDVVGVSRGQIRAWQVGELEFIDRTVELGLGLDRARSVHACWLDEGVEPWFLVERSRVDDPGQEPVPPSMTLLRPSGGRWLQAADLDLDGCGDAGHLTRPRCIDLDADGDQDLVVGCGNNRWLRTDGVRVWRNWGGGHLQPVALPRRGLNQGSFQLDAAIADFDQDGVLDMISVEVWDNGPRVFRGQPDGSLVDVSARSGVYGFYPHMTIAAYTSDQDGDGRPDLILVDSEQGVRAWRGLGDLSFEEREEAWGLHGLGRRPTRDSQLVDIDLDGVRDLVLCGGGCIAARGRAGQGFHSQIVSLPVPATSSRLTTLDLAGGGRGLLVAGEQGPVRLLEVGPAAPVQPPSPAPAPWWLPWARAMRWPSLPLLPAALAPAVGTAVLAWRRTVVSAVAFLLVSGALSLLLLPAHAWVGLLGAALALAGAGLWAFVPRAGERSSQAVEVGTVVAGRYRVARRLGAGGAAIVYEVRDVELDRPCALKVLRPQAASDASLVQRLRTEARALARLRHEHLVQVYTTLELDVGPALVLEFMPGGSLQDCLDRGETFSPQDAVDLTIKVASAVAVAHRADILHRDIKPANVLLDEFGEPGLADFGIARTPDARLTVAGGAVGTFVTMAPEQRAGLVDLDERVDVYALGALLYTLLSGRLPVGLDNPDLRDAMLRDLPDALRPVIVAATRADRDQRLPGAQALIRALTQARSDLRVSP